VALPPRLHINRTRELAGIVGLLDRRDDHGHLVTVEAPPNMGKTALLLELLRTERITAHRVRIDLKHLADVQRVLGELAARLPKAGIDVPTYRHRRDELTARGGPALTLKRTWIWRSRVVVDFDAGRDAAMRAEALLDALAADLPAGSTKSTLVLVDSFDSAGEECRSWIAGQLVPTLCAIPGLVLVIAGRDTRPLGDSERAATAIELRPFRSVHVADWLQALSAEYTAEQLTAVAGALCVAGEGVPATIGRYLICLQAQRWRHS
jgi:hypothetical protein